MIFFESMNDTFMGRTLYPNRPKPTQTDLNQPNRPEIIVITLIIVNSIGFYWSYSRSLWYIVSYMSELKDKISKKRI